MNDRPAPRKTKRNKAPARWGVVVATALTFGVFWQAVSPDPIVAVTASTVEAAPVTATAPMTTKTTTTSTARLRTRGS